MIITISGLPGSGKSTVGKMLAKKLGYKFYSMGDLRGKIALKHGLTIDELNKIGEKDDWTDKEADQYQEELGKREDKAVFDGWISFHFIPHSFKVFLEVDPDKAAARVFHSQRPDEPHQDTPEKIKQMFQARLKQTYGRYMKYYKVDFLNRSHYDLVIDTTDLTLLQIVDKIVEGLKL